MNLYYVDLKFEYRKIIYIFKLWLKLSDIMLAAGQFLTGHSAHYGLLIKTLQKYAIIQKAT